MSESKVSFVYPRLQLAYLLQFAIWGCWSVALGGYLSGKMSGLHIGYLYMAVPLGAIIAPMFIGPIADRYFSAQKVLGFLHFIGGLALVACGAICAHEEAAAAGGSVSIPFMPLMILMLVSGICYMPTIPLINTVVFKHLPDANSAPKVFIFGTAGWILINLVVEIFAGGASSPAFFFIGGGCALFFGVYSFTLPSTPPKGAPAPDEKRGILSILGLDALGMFAHPSFTIFILCAFMVSIFGSNYFFPAIVPYLTEHGYPAAVALSTLNQFSELFFMAILAVCAAKFGLKWVLVLGMAAWGVRYTFFAQDAFSFTLAGLLLHGLGYAFLYTAAYMFGNKVAPDNMKASVQSLIAFLLLGIGQVLSGYIFGVQMDRCLPAIDKDAKQTQTDKAQLPAWVDPDTEDSALRYLDLNKSVGLIFASADKKADWWKVAPNIGTFETKDGKVSNDVVIPLDKIPDKFSVGGREMTKKDLANSVELVKRLSGSTVVKRSDWLKVQQHDWKGFFMPAAYFVFFWTILFMLFGREPAEAKKEEEPLTESTAKALKA